MSSRVTEIFVILSAYAKAQLNLGNTPTVGTIKKTRHDPPLAVYPGGCVTGIKFFLAMNLIVAALISALCPDVFNRGIKVQIC